MANLGFFKIPNTNGKYKSLTEISGITFEVGKKYLLQIQNPCILCEGTSGGFLINSLMPITYYPTKESLNVKVDGIEAYINIAEA